jgi:hypothetical protein
MVKYIMTVSYYINVYHYIKIMLQLLQYKTVTKICYLQTPLK